MADLLYDGLTRSDGEAGVIGAVAASWTISDDQLVWTFALDPDARFADGSSITPADVKASLERVARRGDASLSGLRLSVIDGYAEFVNKTASDVRGIVGSGSTVQFRLRSPYGALAALLADPSMGIVHAKDVASGFSGPPIASGEFAVVARDAESLSLRRAKGSAALADGFEVRLFAEAAGAYGAFARGELDLVPVRDTALDEATAIVAEHGGAIVANPGHVRVDYAFNVASPALRDVRIRQAVLRAVDRDALRREFFPGALGISAVLGLGPDSMGANTCGTSCAYDQAAARALVKAVYPTGVVPTVHVDHFVDADGREAKLAARVASSLVAVGIPAEVRAHSLEEFRALVASGRAELFRYGGVASFPSADALLAPFESAGADNVFSLIDMPLDAALAAARRAGDDATARSAYAAAEERVFAMAAIVPIAQLQTQVMAGASVRGLVLRANGSLDTTTIHLAG
jgi:peptide/nickel transport system substrate-binding protein